MNCPICKIKLVRDETTRLICSECNYTYTDINKYYMDEFTFEGYEIHRETRPLIIGDETIITTSLAAKVLQDMGNKNKKMCANITRTYGRILTINEIKEEIKKLKEGEGLN